MLSILGGSMIWQPGSYGFALDGDGAKNYYTFHYQVLHGSGIWFEGMNHPYGDHLVFADAQPLLAMPLSWLHRHGMPMDGRLTGLLNGLLLWFPYLALLALYRCLRLLGSPRLWSGLAAGCILLASPQWIRLAGHYGLAYPLLPILMWLLLELRLPAKTASKGRPMAIAFGILLLTLAAALLHPYHLALFLVVLGTAAFWSLLQRRWNEVLLQFLPVAVAFLGFSAFSNLGTQPTDRPQFPYGFFEERLEWPMMLSSRWMPRLGLELGSPKAMEFEFNTYLGLLPILGLLLLPVMLLSIRRSFLAAASSPQHAKIEKRHPAQMRALGLLLLLALAGLSMATFFPFRLAGDALTDAVPRLRQFRILARFGWLPYYAWTLAFAAWIGQLLLSRPLKLYVPMLLAGIWLIDASFHTQPILARIHQPIDGVYLNTEEDYPAWLEACGHEASDFQAILALPYFHLGSEEWHIMATTQIKNAAFSASVQTGLPLLNVDMSRTSYRQSMMQLQLLNRNGACTVDHLSDQRPILLLSHPRGMDEHSQGLLDHSERIGNTGPLSLHVLPLARLASPRPGPAPISTPAPRTDTIHRGFRPNGPKISSSAYQPFAKHHIQTQSPVPDTASALLLQAKPAPAIPYTLRFWMKDRLDLPHMPALIVEGFSASGERLWQRSRPLNLRPWDIACQGPWIGIEDTVHWGERTREIRWSVDKDSIGIQWNASERSSTIGLNF